LDEAIKEAMSKMGDNKNQKLSSINPFEQQLTKQFGYPIKVSINKNSSGYFRISFNNQSVMKEIAAKLQISHALSDEGEQDMDFY
jgi:hypothetical protein